MSTNKKSHTVTESSSGLQGLGAAGVPLFNSGLVAPGGSFTYFLSGATNYSYRSTASGDSTATPGNVQMPVIASPPSGGTSTAFMVRWAPAPIPGLTFTVAYQFKSPTATAWPPTWTSWLSNQTGASATFVPTKGAGTYRFRARIRNPSTGLQAGWSLVSSTSCPCQISVT